MNQIFIALEVGLCIIKSQNAYTDVDKYRQHFLFHSTSRQNFHLRDRKPLYKLREPQEALSGLLVQLVLVDFEGVLGASPIASEVFINRRRLHELINIFQGTSPTNIQSPSLSS